MTRIRKDCFHLLKELTVLQSDSPACGMPAEDNVLQIQNLIQRTLFITIQLSQRIKDRLPKGGPRCRPATIGRQEIESEALTKMQALSTKYEMGLSIDRSLALRGGRPGPSPAPAGYRP